MGTAQAAAQGPAPEGSGTVRARAELAVLRALSHPALSRVLGRLAALRLPRPVLRAAVTVYCRAYRVDLSEAAEERWPTFDAFFTRRLREGVRPVCPDADVLVSPSDSRLTQVGPLPPDGRLEQVKGRTYPVEELLGDPVEAAPFRKGFAATLYLSPSMYHRVHAPADVAVRAVRYLPGRLFPVNALGTRRVDRLFAVNERVVVLLDSPLGPLALVLVGAMVVGSISLAFAPLVTNQGNRPRPLSFPSPPRLRRGDELGAFHIGSTVVLLAAEAGLESAGPKPGDLVRMGEPLLRLSRR